jgi:hypothetical protein
LVLIITGVSIVLLYFLLAPVDWVGSKDVEVRFLVVDRQTSKAIEGASITFYEEIGRPVRTIESDSRGTAAIRVKCTTSGRGNAVWGTSHVYFPEWFFEVSKEGYKKRHLERLGRPPEIRMENDARPETIMVELVPSHSQ